MILVTGATGFLGAELLNTANLRAPFQTALETCHPFENCESYLSVNIHEGRFQENILDTYNNIFSYNPWGGC